MRIIIKNADFSVYGLADIGDLMSEVTDKFGGITDAAPVEAFFRSLGADGSNNIWGKIKALYMPCLGVPADGADALYDIIGKQNYPGSSYTIESKRGVGPTTLGSSIGALMEPPELVDDDSLSGFFIVTQSSRQTLGSSSSNFISAGGINVVWNKGALSFNDGSVIVGLPVADNFNSPQFGVFSKRTDGVRTIIAKDTSKTSAVAKVSNTYCLSGPSSWADTAVYAICENLTSDEAAIVAAALDTFITDFGVVSANA